MSTQTDPSISVLIVDDEPPARSNIRRMLDDREDVNIVGEAGDVSTALKMIKQYHPKILFLDIDLGRYSGFDLLEKGVPPEIHIIFITAYNEFAVRAFEVNALDYLLKPVRKQRLWEAVDRYLSNEKKSLPSSRFTYEDQIWIEQGEEYKFLEIKKIAFIQSDRPYTRVFTSKRNSFLVLKSLKKWESELPEKSFLRVHRSTIINLNFITSIKKTKNQTYRVFLENREEPIAVSRRYGKKFKKGLKQNRSLKE